MTVWRLGLCTPLLLACTLCIGLLSSAHAQLSSDAQFNLLQLQLVDAVEALDHEKTLMSIARLRDEKRPLPPSIDFFEGRAHYYLKEYFEAKPLFEKYINEQGSDATYYDEALSLYRLVVPEVAAAQAEQKRKAEEARRAAELAARRKAEAERVAEEKRLEEQARRIAEQERSSERPEEQPGPGETFRDCDGCPQMVVVPAGQFMMGSLPDKPETPRSQYERNDLSGISVNNNEIPQHQVTFSKPFAVGRFEVTIREWNQCLADKICSPTKSEIADWPRTHDMPANNVTWVEAKRFLSWLTARSGKTYRLLTEAEWEYAARAGSRTEFAFGDRISKSHAALKSKLIPGDPPIPVGSFRPNAFGLYDMHGNVWELVEDCYFSSHDGAPADGSVRLRPDCDRVVVRGGSIWNRTEGLRSASRANSLKTATEVFGPTGFRVARDLE